MRRVAMLAFVALACLSPIAPASASRLRATTVRTQTTPGQITPTTHTGPGLNTGAGKDEVSGRAVRGIAFLALALVVVGWLFRLRVRDWMLGRQTRRPEPPGLGPDEPRS